MPDKTTESRWTVLLIPLAVLATLATVVVVILAATSNGGGDAEVEREADRLRAEFEARDARQIVALTETARLAREDLTPVLEEMSESLPPDGPPEGRVASSASVTEWRSAVREASARFGDPPSGETATNVARASLVAAVDGLESSILTYEQAADLPDQYRARMLERAASQRDLAVRVWSIGGTQLDAVNVDSGNGHQHVYLPAAGVGGAFSADPAPEGSEAQDPEE